MLQLNHPNFFDGLALKFFPGYLYQGQLCQTLATVNVGIIHKLPDIKPFWKIMDYLYLKKGSVMRYLGKAGSLDVVGDVLPAYSVFELLQPEVDEKKSFGKQLSGGDWVCLTPFDRQFIAAAPENIMSSHLVFPEPEA
jgi:hypothetical protein